MPCKVCKQPPNIWKVIRQHKDSQKEKVVVKKKNLAVITFEEAVVSDFPMNFRATDANIFNENGHLVDYEKGLIKEGHDLYISGTVWNLLDEESNENAKVALAGPIVAWRKQDQEGKIILTTKAIQSVQSQFNKTNDHNNDVTIRLVKSMKPKVIPHDANISKAKVKKPHGNRKELDILLESLNASPEINGAAAFLLSPAARQNARKKQK